MEKDLKRINKKRTNLRDSQYENDAEEPNELQQLLLKGPTMSDEQFNQLKQIALADYK